MRSPSVSNLKADDCNALDWGNIVLISWHYVEDTVWCLTDLITGVAEWSTQTIAHPASTKDNTTTCGWVDYDHVPTIVAPFEGSEGRHFWHAEQQRQVLSAIKTNNQYKREPSKLNDWIADATGAYLQYKERRQQASFKISLVSLKDETKQDRKCLTPKITKSDQLILIRYTIISGIWALFSYARSCTPPSLISRSVGWSVGCSFEPA